MVCTSGEVKADLRSENEYDYYTDYTTEVSCSSSCEPPKSVKTLMTEQGITEKFVCCNNAVLARETTCTEGTRYVEREILYGRKCKTMLNKTHNS